MNIYAEMYETRLLQALKHDFPWTVQLLRDTDEAFAQRVRAYVRAYPLRSFTLAQVGERFPAFIAKDPPRADIGEVARLEWMRGAVSIAADIAALPVAALGQHGAAIVEMHCVFAPTMHHTEAAHDVCAVVDALVANTEPPNPAARACELVAWRRDDQVFHTALVGPAAQALRVAAAGGSIATICDVFATCPKPAEVAFAAVGAWFADGWVQRLA